MNINMIIVCPPSISASLAVFFQLAMQGPTLTLGLILLYTGLTGKPDLQVTHRPNVCMQVLLSLISIVLKGHCVLEI